MNRFAKKFRIFSSLCMLLNLVALFVPVTRCIQENYPDITYHQLDYICNVPAKWFSFSPGNALELTDGQVGWILLFMVLPLVLSVVSGIWGIAGSQVQKISSILSAVVLLLNIGMAAGIGNLWPEAAEGQVYCRGMACTLLLVFSGCGTVFALASLIAAPKKVKVTETAIPQVEEIKQQQVEAKYNIMMEENQKEIRKEDREPVQPEHGVMVGLTGIYAGARIPLTDGEYILMGRQADSHLVFEGQAKVSRNHCRIKWDVARQKYIFRDYSSNGSFVNGSEDCLPQNLDLELAPGTTIAIGDETNSFRLE